MMNNGFQYYVADQKKIWLIYEYIYYKGAAEKIKKTLLICDCLLQLPKEQKRASLWFPCIVITFTDYITPEDTSIDDP